tara:strand:+ start:4397 stop:5017 length:621 start_codon:yes stop_codon:yes gene_type:complete
MTNIFLLTIIILLFLIILIQIWIYRKNLKDDISLSNNISKEFIEKEKDLKKIYEELISVNGLLETYNKVIQDKSDELKVYKEASSNNKEKALFSSLIGILEFVEKFNRENKIQDEKTKNYLTAIQDKLDLALSASGLEKFEPDLHQNIMDVTGCSPNIFTKKTSDPKKVNLISKIIKPGYRILIKDDKFNYIKNAEVEIFELEKNE